MKQFIILTLLSFLIINSHAVSTPALQLAMDHVPIIDQLPYNSSIVSFKIKKGLSVGYLDGLSRYMGIGYYSDRIQNQIC